MFHIRIMKDPYQNKVNEDDVTTMLMIFYITNASLIHISNQTHK